MNEEQPKVFLSNIFHDIGLLIIDKGNLTHFHEKLRGFNARLEAFEKANQAHEKANQAHMKAAEADPRLCNEKKGPPEKGWVWEKPRLKIPWQKKPGHWRPPDSESCTACTLPSWAA